MTEKVRGMADPTVAELKQLTALSEEGWTVIFSTQGWTGRDRFGHMVGPHPTAKKFLEAVDEERPWVQ